MATLKLQFLTVSRKKNKIFEFLSFNFFEFSARGVSKILENQKKSRKSRESDLDEYMLFKKSHQQILSSRQDILNYH